MLASDAGMINCCSSRLGGLCFRVPASYPASELLPLSAASPPLSSLPRVAEHHSSNSNLLHAIPLKHDPYTPDSMDSPSPNAIAADYASSCCCPLRQDSSSSAAASAKTLKPQRPDRAVSPALLKSRLELIAQNRQTQASSNSNSASNSNSPDEDHPGIPDDTWSARKSRSNSDVSWQRSHLLTRAWLQGKGQQAYHSFSSNLHRTDDHNEHQQQHFVQDQRQEQSSLVIPRIAIINASNFQSNASSVHLYDDPTVPKKQQLSTKGHSPPDQYLDALYANARTRSLSEADSSQGRSPAALTLEEEDSDDEFREKIVEEQSAPIARENIEEESKLGSTPPAVRQESEPSKNTTRSNSIQSQEANVSLKLKAYNKVTERCKRNIVGKKGRCKKCCVLS